MLYTYDNGKMAIECECCGHKYFMDYDRDIELAYTRGVNAPIQTVFPEMPSELRELMVTGECGLCFDGKNGYFRYVSKDVNDFVKKECSELIIAYGLYDIFECPLTAQELFEALKDYEEYDGIANDNIDEFVEAMRDVLRKATRMIEDEEEGE